VIASQRCIERCRRYVRVMWFHVTLGARSRMVTCRREHLARELGRRELMAHWGEMFAIFERRLLWRDEYFN